MITICGLDWSKSSPAATFMELDENLDIRKVYFHSVSKVKKNEIKSDSSFCKYYSPKDMNDMEKAIFMRDTILPGGMKIDYAAIEGYAYAAIGQVFDIAEAAMAAKLKLFEHFKAKIRIYDIQVHKKAFSRRGNSDKVSMFDAYNGKFPEDPLMLKSWKLPEPAKKEGVSPTSDIIDSFSVCSLLRTELLLRAGLKQMKELPEHVICAFNHISSAQPVNLLDSDFIELRKAATD
jgi:hypothetical protein